MSNKKGIAEIYPCIQGEGSRVGHPSILIRTLGCNLRCGWCDTPFTSWKREKGSFSNKDIIPILESNPQIHEVIVTGGEPCLYKELDDLIDICKKYQKAITVETNGTLTRSQKMMESIDLVSISPKLSNSIPSDSYWRTKHDNSRINVEAILQWINWASDYQLKFVVSSTKDLDEIEELLKHVDIDKQKVYLMPEGTTEEQLHPKRQWLADLCIKEGYSYCERIHIVIYGDKRGV